MWTDVYRPKTSAQVLGNASGVAAIRRYLEPSTTPKKPLLLHGPPGTGKTLAAHLCCQEAGLAVMELNASSERNKEVQRARAECIDRHLGKRGICYVLDEVDVTESVASLVASARCPVICICNDVWARKLAPLKKLCQLVPWQPVPPFVMSKWLSTLPGVQLQAIVALSSTGDVRHALNELQFGGQIGVKDNRPDLFREATNLFASGDLLAEPIHDLTPLMVQENYPRVDLRSVRPDSLVEAAESMSYGALLENHVLTTNDWSALPQQMFAQCVAPSWLRKGTLRNAAFPVLLGKTSSINSRTAEQTRLARLVGVPAKDATLYFSVLASRVASCISAEGIDAAFALIKLLDKPDWDSILELSGVSIASKDKAALTRKFTAQSKPEPRSRAKSEPKSGPRSRAKPEAKSEAKSEPKSGPRSGARSGAKSEAKPRGVKRKASTIDTFFAKKAKN